MPATPGQMTPQNTGMNVNPITGQPMAQPQMSGVQINPITGLPM